MDDIIPQDIPLKQCSKCKDFFPATPDFFSRAKIQKDGLRPACRTCMKAQSKIYNDAHVERRKRLYQEHREEISQKTKQYRAAHSEEVREKQRNYYKAHREHRRELAKNFAQRHREKVLARGRRYHWEHREQAIKKMKDRRNAHREEYLERDRHYHATHSEQRKAYKKSYQAKNYEQIREKRLAYHKTERSRIIHRAAWHKREARKKAIDGTLTTQQIQDKLRLQHYRCYYAACGFAKFEKRDGKYIFHLEHTIPISRTEHNPRHDMSYTVLACPHCNLSKNNKLPHEFFEGGRLF